MKYYINLLAPIFLGIIAFGLITGGYILFPDNIGWLAGGFDPTQHYLGWAFYKFGPWTFPVGLNPNFGMAYSNAIVFSDSIPIFAVLFKVINSIIDISSPFQYLGMWTFLCFVLQAYFSWLLIGKFSDRFDVRLFGSIILLFAPPLLARIGSHTALAAHFLILIALYLYISKPIKFKNFKWLAVIMIASLTHFYLLVMVLLIWIAKIIDQQILNKFYSLKNTANEIIVILLTLLVSMWQAGYFSISVGSAAASGYGFYRMNLLSIIDSRGWSYILNAIPMPMDFGDGFNYFGLGGLIILSFAAYAVIKKKCSVNLILKGRYALFLLCVFLTAFAVTNNIGLGNLNYLISLPDWVIAAANNLRGSGRMFWPVYYCIQLLMIFIVVKSYSGSRLTWILLISALLQAVDTSAGWLSTRKGLINSYNSKLNTPLKNEFWNEAAKKYKNVMRVPGKNIATEWEIFADYAAKNKHSTNFTFLSRIDNQKLINSNSILIESIIKGTYENNSLYIFEDWKSNPIDVKLRSEDDFLGIVDGYTVLAPGYRSNQNLNKLIDTQTITSLVPNIEIGSEIIFSNKGQGRKLFLLDGWGYSEDWGTWSDGSYSLMRIPMPSGIKPTRLEFNVRGFVGPGHPSQIFDLIMNGVTVQTIEVSNFENNKFQVPLSDVLKNSKFITIELKYRNPAYAFKFGGFSGDTRLLGIGLKSLAYQN